MLSRLFPNNSNVISCSLKGNEKIMLDKSLFFFVPLCVSGRRRVFPGPGARITGSLVPGRVPAAFLPGSLLPRDEEAGALAVWRALYCRYSRRSSAEIPPAASLVHSLLWSPYFSAAPYEVKSEWEAVAVYCIPAVLLGSDFGFVLYLYQTVVGGVSWGAEHLLRGESVHDWYQWWSCTKDNYDIYWCILVQDHINGIITVGKPKMN